MNPIGEHEFGLLADAVRRRRNATCSADAADALERHSYRMMSLIDDLAEGESLNAIDYQIVRAAAILHDVAAPKARPSAAAEASAQLAEEMLTSVGVDGPFLEAVVEAVRRHAGARLLDVDGGEPCDDLETCPQMLVHDACLLARLEATSPAAAGADPALTMKRMREAAASLCTQTARRFAAPVLERAEHSVAAPVAIG
jgi:HD superfamily phosphodiesterase